MMGAVAEAAAETEAAAVATRALTVFRKFRPPPPRARSTVIYSNLFKRKVALVIFSSFVLSSI